MGNPQKIKFKNLADFNNAISEQELEIVEILRESIYDSIPEIRERLAYNVPFFYRKRRLCFIWPASVPWGGISSGVALGFVQGSKMTTLPVLPGKQIASIVFQHKNEIDKSDLETWLFEALQIDEDQFNLRKSK